MINHDSPFTILTGGCSGNGHGQHQAGPQLSAMAPIRTMQNIEQKGGVHMDQHRRVLITQDGESRGCLCAK